MTAVTLLWCLAPERVSAQGRTERSPAVTRAIEGLAVKTLSEWNALSISLRTEFGGMVCEPADGVLYVTGPALSEQFQADQVVPRECFRREPQVGDLHTHGRFGDDGPSDPDLRKADGRIDVAFYVATPCNRIYYWQGPNARNSLRRLDAQTPIPQDVRIRTSELPTCAP